MVPDHALVGRFKADLDALCSGASPLGVAVSGGPDSLALLLLAATARPGHVEAATVDHRLRPESAAEAQMVADVCKRLSVPHTIMALDWGEVPSANLQALARERRYEALAGWAAGRGLDVVATAHHLDDQAETVMMRLARGSGVGGLAGIQPSRALGDRIRLIRPLLNWTREELRAVVDGVALVPVDDPANEDERFDRSRVRGLLRDAPWLEPARLAAIATHAADAEAALDWIADREFRARMRREGETLTLDPRELPRELQRRLLLEAIAVFTDKSPSGPQLMSAMRVLAAGGTQTLSGLLLQGGPVWRLSRAPPRRTKRSDHGL